jgi:hypothetical protein
MLSDLVDDFHQSVNLDKQKITFNLIGLDPDLKYFKSIFKTRTELIESIKILQTKCVTDGLAQDRKIEQTMQFFKPAEDDNNRSRDEKLLCKTVIFNNGRQKSQTSHAIHTLANVSYNSIGLDESIPYEIDLSEMIDTDDISVNDCIAMVANLKLSFTIHNWVLSVMLSKTWYNSDYKYNAKYRRMLSIPEKAGSKKLTIHRLKEIKSKLLNSEFTTDNFTKEAPYNYADVIKVQLDFVTHNTYFNKSYIRSAVKLLENSLIDTCRISTTDIFIKIATILKLPQLAKYQNGEFGIKQLTSRVVTLDHDILHRELIPAFGNYAVSEKIDGITSTVLILNKEMFVTCGSIVYKFDVTSFPSLPPTKNIESLGLNKIDFNNTWIFDAEVLTSPDGILTIMPFDIRMASSINVDNINFKYRLMFMAGLIDLKANKVIIKNKKWYRSNDIKVLYESKTKSEKCEGFIFAYLDSLNFTTSMYYANKIWKWKPKFAHVSEEKKILEGGGLPRTVEVNVGDNNTIDFLIQNCPETLKGKAPYITSGKNLYVLTCGLSKSVHQSLPNIKVEQSLIPNNANEYIPALFSPSDKPYSHLYWSDQANLASEIGEFSYNVNTQTWTLIRLRTDRKIEVERGNYFGNDHKTAENNWFIINNPLTLDNILTEMPVVNPYASKQKFINALYENLVKHVIPNNETVLNICPVTIMECFNKFTSVIYAFNNTIESNRYIKDKYELAKKRIRFNSYYVQTPNIRTIPDKLKNSTIPISKNGFDNLILTYTIDRNDQTAGFDSLMQGFKTVETYEELINRNGKIIIVVNEAPDANIKTTNFNSNNFKIKAIDDAFQASKYKKILDIPVNKWVYIPDPDLYEHSRILVFSRNKKDEVITN